MARLGLILLVSLATGLWISPVAGHGPWDWVRQGGYQGNDGLHCCSERDCYVVPPNTVRTTATGWAVEVGSVTLYFTEGEKGVHYSQDGQFWMCVKPDGSWRCFFAPPLGA